MELCSIFHFSNNFSQTSHVDRDPVRRIDREGGCHYAKGMELWGVGVCANQGQELEQGRAIDFRLV